MRKSVLAICLLSLLLLACGNSDNDKSNRDENPLLGKKVELQYNHKNLEISERSFLIGTAGYTPPNFPNSSAAQVKDYWYEVNQIGEVYGVHTDWKDTNIISIASKQFDGDILLVLGFQSADEWVNSRQDYEDTLLSLLDNNQKIKYLAIGNEINNLYLEDPLSFMHFVESYKAFYSSVKEKHPDLIIFTTFQFEWMIGEGALSGKAPYIEPQLELLTMFEGYYDAVGITLYPFFDYDLPEEVPSDYLSVLNSLTDKPIIITETAWISRPDFKGSSASLNSTGYVGSQEEQVSYLYKLIEIAQGSNVLIVDWIFLNDPYDWESNENTPTLQTFESAGLKDYRGNPKLVWDYWLSLKDIEY